MDDPALAQALREAVLARHFERTPDRRLGGAPIPALPSLDLAVVGFPHDGQPAFWANVLFSREWPLGLVADCGPRAESPRNLRYVADLTDERFVSVAWMPGADWSRLPFPPLAGPLSAPRVVAPYPASLLKLMVAVGVGLALDAGRCTVAEVDATARAMIVDSDNEATTALVRALHTWGLIARRGHIETQNALHEAFTARGLPTLRLARTAPDGGWGNAAGAGVGHIQMTAWDTVRLLWLLDPQAPPPPWPGGTPLLSPASRDRVLGWTAEPSPNRILFVDEGAAGLHFSHKTGTTENYASDAGIVRAQPPARRHYLVALLSNLGTRYAVPGADDSPPPSLGELGLAVDALMRERLEPR